MTNITDIGNITWNGTVDIGPKLITCADIYDGIMTKLGAYMVFIFVLVMWLIVTDLLESRGRKGKSCLRRYRGNEWHEKSRMYVYAWLMMVAIYVIQVVYIGAMT